MLRSIYYFRKRLLSTLKSLASEITKPTNYIKGDEFEEFLRKEIYCYPNFELVMKTHSYIANKGDFIEMTKYPDFLFRDKSGNEFYVEAKYRERTFQDKVKWSHEKQFARYKEISKTKKVVVAIGLGGRPKNPKRLFIIPLEYIKYHQLYEREYIRYERAIPKRSMTDRMKDFLYS